MSRSPSLFIWMPFLGILISWNTAEAQYNGCPPPSPPPLYDSTPSGTGTVGLGTPGSFAPSGVGSPTPRPPAGGGTTSPGLGTLRPAAPRTTPSVAALRPFGLAGLRLPRPVPGGGSSARSTGRRGETGPFGDGVPGDSWLNWWRLNEAWRLDLDRRYVARARDRDFDDNLSISVDVPSARPLDATSASLRRRVIPVLERLTRHPHGAVRAEAVLALGKMGQPADLHRITPLLSDGDGDVRRAAILALGLLKTPLSRPFLTSILMSRRRQDAEIAYAAVALGVSGQRESVPGLIERLKKGRGAREVESAILYALGLIDTPRARTFLEFYVLSPSRDGVLRSVAVQALALGGHPETTDVLSSVLGDSDVNVRRSACIGLGQVRFTSPLVLELETAERELAERFDGDGSGPAHLIADDFLGKLRLKAEEDTRRLASLKEEIVKRLIDVGLEDSDVMVRNFSALALGELGGDGAREALRHLLATARRDSSRSFAALGLAIQGDKADRKTVFRRLTRGRMAPSARAALMLSLGFLGEGDVADFAIRRLQNLGDATSSRFAAISLGLVGEKRALPLLRNSVARRGRPELKRAFGLGLALLGDTDVLESLGKLLSTSKSSEMRIQTAAILSAMRDGAALDALLKAMISTRRPAKDIELAAFTRAIGIMTERGRQPILAPAFRHLNYLVPVRALREIALL